MWQYTLEISIENEAYFVWMTENLFDALIRKRCYVRFGLWQFCRLFSCSREEKTEYSSRWMIFDSKFYVIFFFNLNIVLLLFAVHKSLFFYRKNKWWSNMVHWLLGWFYVKKNNVLLFCDSLIMSSFINEVRLFFSWFINCFLTILWFFDDVFR